ncbi:MAG TPA: hypothetical protein VGO51_02265 [Burkholderiaceae bacterium]|nr:hypothetical protein [Burkholderiaceae bacterium]
MVATSLTFETTVCSILFANPAAGLSLLILTPDCFASLTTIAVVLTAGTTGLRFASVRADASIIFTVPVSAAAAFFAFMALATDLGADLDTGFLPAFNADLACGFAVFFTVALTGFAAAFATVFAGLAPGFRAVVIFFTNFLATLFSVDSPAVLPVSLGLATATGLVAVLPGFLATVLFLTDFVTVAFMSLSSMNCPTH